MDSEVFLVLEITGNRVRKGADTQLDGGVVLNQAGTVVRNFLGLFVDTCPADGIEGRLLIDDIVYVIDVQHLAADTGEVGVDLGDNLSFGSCAHGGLGEGAVDAVGAHAVFVRLGNLHICPVRIEDIGNSEHFRPTVKVGAAYVFDRTRFIAGAGIGTKECRYVLEVSGIGRIHAAVGTRAHAMDDGHIVFLHTMVIERFHQSGRFTKPVSENDLVAILHQGDGIFGGYDLIRIFFFPIHDNLLILSNMPRAAQMRE